MMLNDMIAATMMNSATIRLYTSLSAFLTFETKMEGITIPSAAEASTAKVEIAVTAGR